MSLTRARLVNLSTPPGAAEDAVEVMYNPTEFNIDRGASYAELAVPGLESPLLQFVRGEAETLGLELFLDGSDGRLSLDGDLAKLRRFVKIDKKLHAPPVCRFEWGEQTEKFQGVVTSLKEKYVLFGDDGRILRARVTISMKSYTPADAQLRNLKRESPDHTRYRVVREGETLDQIAGEAYGNPRLWRVIAEANDIDRPRFVPPGTPLLIPAV